MNWNSIGNQITEGYYRDLVASGRGNMASAILRRNGTHTYYTYHLNNHYY